MSPFGSDFVGRPEPVVVTRDEYRVPPGRVLCSCGYVIRVRAGGTLTKHDLPTARIAPARVCPMSGQPATPSADVRCSHCLDDPPSAHTCPACGAVGSR